MSLHPFLPHLLPSRSRTPLYRYQHSRGSLTCATRSHTCARRTTSSQGTVYVQQLPRHKQQPRRQHNAADTREPIRSGPKLLRRERLLGPTPFLHTTARARCMCVCFFFSLSLFLVHRSLLLLGWTRVSPLLFSSGRAFRDTSLVRSHFLPDSCFASSPPIFPDYSPPVTPFPHASKRTVQSRLRKLAEYIGHMARLRFRINVIIAATLKIPEMPRRSKKSFVRARDA